VGAVAAPGGEVTAKAEHVARRGPTLAGHLVDEQRLARMPLSESLAAVVAQMFLPTADGKGRVAMHEVLPRSALANLIREGNAAMISNAIQARKERECTRRTQRSSRA
jgi:Tfp pilus assembly pilus retraction ATPase PilT